MQTSTLQYNENFIIRIMEIGFRVEAGLRSKGIFILHLREKVCASYVTVYLNNILFELDKNVAIISKLLTDSTVRNCVKTLCENTLLYSI